MPTAAILTAAGSGTRLGRSVPKALVELGGVPIVVRAADNLALAGCLDSIVVTVPPHAKAEFGRLFTGGQVPGTSLPVHVIPGDVTRQASVAAGLEALDGDVDVVLVHDAARCLTPPDLVSAVERSVRSGHRAVVPGVPVSDTIKEVGPADATGAEPVVATVDRRALRAVQTPQGFDRELLQAAHARGAHLAQAEGSAASDDAALVEAMGERVWMVPGHPRALKVTTPTDFALAELLL